MNDVVKIKVNGEEKRVELVRVFYGQTKDYTLSIDGVNHSFQYDQRYYREDAETGRSWANGYLIKKGVITECRIIFVNASIN